MNMKQKTFLLMFATSLLFGCQTVATNSTEAPGAATYRAVGTEPFWSLEVTGQSMRFSLAGENEIRATCLKISTHGNARRFSAGSLVANVAVKTCSDGMSDRRYRDTVTLTFGTQRFKGCGGAILAPETLAGTTWRIVSINGALIPTEPQASLMFDDSRMNGTVGCNRFGGSYTFSKGTLSFGPLMSTKMGCPALLGAREDGVTKMLGTLKSSGFAESGEMILTGIDGYTVVLEHAI